MMETPAAVSRELSAPARARPHFRVTINVGEREAQPLLPVTTVARSATRPRVSGFTWDSRSSRDRKSSLAKRVEDRAAAYRQLRASQRSHSLGEHFSTPRHVLTRPHPRRRWCNIENVARAGQTARRRLPPLVCLLANKIGCEIKAAFAALVESVSDFAERLRQNTALLHYASLVVSRGVGVERRLNRKGLVVETWSDDVG